MPLERNVRRALIQFEKAVGMKVFKGSYPPEEHANINCEYRKTKQKLIEILQRVPHESIRERSDAKIQRKTIPATGHSE